MRSRPAALFLVLGALVACLFVAQPAIAAAATRVAVIKSAVAGKAPYCDTTYYYARCDMVEALLEGEFGAANVDEIGDSALDSTNPDVLAKYDVLVFPRHVAMTAIQRQHVRDYVAGGGGLVAMFQLANWDYTPTRTPKYKAVHQIYTPLGVPADNANAWRWGETSELRRVKFVNDPLMYQNWKAVSAPISTHWILSQTAAELGKKSLSLTYWRAGGDYNEIDEYMPGTSVRTLFTYDVRNNASTADDYAYDINGVRHTVTGSPAGWTADYYYGRIAYYGFQLHDLAWNETYGPTDTVKQARRLLINSVKWTAQHDAYVNPRKSVLNSGTTSFSRGTLTVDHRATNNGGLPMSGTMLAQVITPSGKVAYTNKYYNIILPGGAAQTKRSSFNLGARPASGTWKVRLSFAYWDYMHGGWVSSYRDLLYKSTGSGLIYLGSLTQVEPTSGRAPTGTVVQGSSRYDTAAAIAAKAYPSGVSSQRTVILAPGTNFQDALAASGLAGRYDAPILLTPKDSLAPATGTRLTALFSGEPSATVLIIGDANNIGTATEAAARSAVAKAGVPANRITIRRIGSGDAYTRSRAIAQEIGLPKSGPFANTVIVASGTTFADSLSMSALAVRHKIPILFASTSVPDATRRALVALNPDHTLIVGGTFAVSDSAESWLESNGYREAGVGVNRSDPDSRLAGTSRYDTSLEVLRATCDPRFGGFAETGLIMTTGVNFPDAIAGGPMASRANQPLLLVNGQDMGTSPRVGGYLMRRRETPPTPLTFLGGKLAVSDFVRGQVGVALGTCN